MHEKVKSSHAAAAILASIVVLLSFTSQVKKLSLPVAFIAEPRQLTAQVATPASITLSPSTGSITVGTPFFVNIMLNTGGQNVYGVDINKLRFSTAVLEIADTDAIVAGTNITQGTIMTKNFVNTVDNVAGTLQFSQVADPDGAKIFNGTGILGTVKFNVKAAGTASVNIDFTPNLGTDSNVAGDGVDLLGSVGTASFTATAPDTTDPTQPGAPVLNVISPTQINLTWAASTDASGIKNYVVERCSGTANCTGYAVIASPTATSYNDLGLTQGTIYRYRIKAVDNANRSSSYSISSNATTPVPDTTAPNISATQAISVTTNAATITWTTNEASDSYVEYGLTTTYGTVVTNATMVTNHSIPIGPLAAGTVYHFRVKSKDAANNSSPLTVDNVFTTVANSDNTPPTVPTGLIATANTETEVQLSWNASTDPQGPGEAVSGVKHYEIYRNNTLLSTSLTTNFKNTGLTAGTAYSYQVTAVDNAGKTSAKSPAVSVTTPTFSLAVQRKIVIVPEGAPATKRVVSGTIELIDPATGLNLPNQITVTTDNLGVYTLSVPAGIVPRVNMRARMTGYLSKIINDIDLRDTNVLTVTFPTLLAGDFDSNKEVNVLDFSSMNAKWGTNDSLTDLNKDGEVNTLDFSFLARNWMLTGE
jgi:fibronectin type 3 domain-containing protein